MHATATAMNRTLDSVKALLVILFSAILSTQSVHSRESFIIIIEDTRKMFIFFFMLFINMISVYHRIADFVKQLYKDNSEKNCK